MKQSEKREIRSGTSAKAHLLVNQRLKVTIFGGGVNLHQTKSGEVATLGHELGIEAHRRPAIAQALTEIVKLFGIVNQH